MKLFECSRLWKGGPNKGTKITEELEFFNLKNKTLNSKLQLKHHVVRMDDWWIKKKKLTQVIRRPDIGHPQLRWRDQPTSQGDGIDQHGLVHEEDDNYLRIFEITYETMLCFT